MTWSFAFGLGLVIFIAKSRSFGYFQFLLSRFHRGHHSLGYGSAIQNHPWILKHNRYTTLLKEG